MTRLSRVLAAVDFSKPALGAFEYALTLSQQHGAELVVVHAVPPNETFNRHARQRLALTMKLRRRADEAKVAFSERVQQGDAAATILLHARSLDPDVIVMGTHQRGGFERLRRGSVSERVTTTATTPVLSIPRRRDRSLLRPFRHVAVAVDFSVSSARAIEHVSTLANGSTDRITLLHVVPRVGPGPIRDAAQRLRRAVLTTPHTRAAVDARVLVGNTTTALSRGVDSIGPDLLIVGVPNRGAVSRALFGTTAARLLRVIGVPLLAVPAASSRTAGQEGSAMRRAA